MSFSKDYYAILEVLKDASQDQIKKAYRRLAIKWHPDKNLESKELATRKFKEIAEAYDALYDPEKRKAYDRYGADGMQQMSRGQSHGGVNPDDIFQAFFGGADPLSELFGQGRGVRPGVHFQTFGAGGQQFQFGGNLFSGFSGFEGQRSRGRVNLPCTLEEVYNGATKRVRAFGEACEVKVPAGSKAGDIIPNDRNSFKVDVLPHISYSLDGRNLLYTAVVHPHELLLGCKIKVRLLDATEKIVDFPGILEGRRLVIKGLGLPATAGARRGDLIITPSLLSPGLSSSLWAATKFGVILWLFMVMYSYPSLLFLLLILKQFF